MPTLPSVRRVASRHLHVVVLGDLLLDVAVVPERPLVAGTDVAGRVALRQGGSAATAARWLARLGVRTTFVTAVGRDAPGRALVDLLRGEGITVRAVRPAGGRTGRIAVIVGAGGERSFVADRGVADGRRAARERVLVVAPDILLATLAECHALLGGVGIEPLLELAPIAVVKRGAKGATVLARPFGNDSERLRFEVATRPIEAADTTGAGDAFDAGFLATWLAARRDKSAPGSALHRSVLAGHRAAARQLTTRREELSFG